MQRLDERKRRLITEAATRLFAARPFHEVKLDQVASAAKVGKGTVYLYFKNKEDLYISLIHDGFAQLVDRLKEQLGREDLPPWLALQRVVGELAEFAVSHPDLYELMRSVPMNKLRTGKRRELTDLIETIIRRGMRAAAMADPHPDLTANFVPAMVRAAMLFGPKGLSAQTLADQIIGLLSHGLGRKGGNGR
jgi:AcrR family transcriptional regulator